MRNQFYRPEIDGLRALAVIPVVLYHLGVQLFSGGFVGVDIFFVVSGYLITQIIMRHIDAQGFSIVQFYERRARRIAPALIAVVLFTWLMALLLFLPDDLLRFGNSLVATVLFSSNFLFWSETGYFAAPSEFKPLLHTWSLAVEEQFYILYPLLMLLIHKYWRKALLPALWLGFISSFLLSVWGSVHTPGAAFFLAPTRAWELILGALLAMNALPRPANQMVRNSLSLLGLILIGWAVFAFTPETRFPGMAALTPCLGAGLIIHASDRNAWGVGRLLSLKPIVAVGLISYSLYLWHWPLIVFAKYYLVRELELNEMFGLLVVSFLLAYASWRWVEQPFRRPGGVFERKGLFKATAIVGVALIGLGLALHYQDGWSPRFLDSELQMLKEAKARDPKRLECLDLNPQRVLAGELCVVGERTYDAPSFFLWGDSHADAIMPALDKEARLAGEWGYYAFYVSCPPLIGIDNVWRPPSHECRAFNDAMLKIASERDIKNIVLAARWSTIAIGRIQEAGSGQTGVESSQLAFKNGLSRTLAALENANRQVWIVEQAPWGQHDVPQALALGRRFGREVSEIEPLRETHETHQAFVLRVFDEVANGPNIHRVDPAEVLCGEITCQVMAESRSLYSDDDHLSEFGAMWVSEIFYALFETRARP